MFNSYIYVNDNQSVKEAARIAAKASREHDKTLRDISENEIKSKDRVDISLAAYEELQRELSHLRSENRRIKTAFLNIGIPAEIIDMIIPDSIKVQRCEDYRDFKMHYQVYFSVDDSPDIRKRRMI